MLKNELEGADLEAYVEERLLTTTLEKAANWARGNAFMPATFGPRPPPGPAGGARGARAAPGDGARGGAAHAGFRPVRVRPPRRRRGGGGGGDLRGARRGGR